MGFFFKHGSFSDAGLALVDEMVDQSAPSTMDPLHLSTTTKKY